MVKQTRLTTDQADVIEIRLEMEDTWESSDGAATMEFHLSGSCHYHLADNQLTDLTVENVELLTTEAKRIGSGSEGLLRQLIGTRLRRRATAGPAKSRPDYVGSADCDRRALQTCFRAVTPRLCRLA